MESQLLQLSYTLDELASSVKKFWDVANTSKILAFSGEMGAGKTTFIHHLCDFLQVQDTVSSPTFALINEYHFTDSHGVDETIYHLDWYRLKDAEEAITAGMEDCLLQAAKGAAYCFIEWPEKAMALLQKPYLWISIETLPDINERRMTVTLVK